MVGELPCKGKLLPLLNVPQLAHHGDKVVAAVEHENAKARFFAFKHYAVYLACYGFIIMLFLTSHSLSRSFPYFFRYSSNCSKYTQCTMLYFSASCTAVISSGLPLRVSIIMSLALSELEKTSSQ